MPKSRLGQDRLPLILRALCLVLLALTVVIMGLPMLNVVSVSLSDSASSEAPGLLLIPVKPSTDGYSFIWKSTNIGRPLFNTVFVSVVGTLLHVLLCSLAGYILCQPALPLKKAMTTFVLVTMTIPSELTLIGIYAVNKDLGLLNTYSGLIINGMVSGFSILLMRNYFMTIPQSLAESARMDGASELLIFMRIYMRLASAGLVTIGTLEFIRRWNNITMTITLISDMKLWTMPVVLKFILFDPSSTSGSTYIFSNAKMAAVVITAAPLVVLYFFAQRFLVGGVLLGAVKE